MLNKMQNSFIFTMDLYLFLVTPLEAHQCSINYPAKDREKRTPSIHKVMNQEILTPYWYIPRTLLVLTSPYPALRLSHHCPFQTRILVYLKKGFAGTCKSFLRPSYHPIKTNSIV